MQETNYKNKIIFYSGHYTRGLLDQTAGCLVILSVKI